MTQRFELSAIYDARNSFHGKAMVEITDTEKVLYSYNTKVCMITDKVVLFNVPQLWSDTTTRHIKEFLKQNDYRADSKAQILADYEVVEAE